MGLDWIEFHFKYPVFIAFLFYRLTRGSMFLIYFMLNWRFIILNDSHNATE